MLPGRGRIGIFNRSYYEEVLVARVHGAVLKNQKLPSGVIGKNIWKHRFQDIRAFERHLSRNGTLILKFHLRISKEEQRKRFLARLDEPAKRWKFSRSDIAERQYWDRYMTAYEEMVRATSTDYAPWYVVPADHKHVAWLVVAEAINAALDDLKLVYPKIDGKALKELEKVERALQAQAPKRAAK
jgi:polyphosphate kinase 2 (PPK2 family)